MIVRALRNEVAFRSGQPGRFILLVPPRFEPKTLVNAARLALSECAADLQESYDYDVDPVDTATSSFWLEDLPVRLGVCAASIERAAEHWFTTGPLVPAILASAAVPGLLPPAEIDGEHFLDGGLVNSVPVGRAVELGATRVFVLQVVSLLTSSPVGPQEGLVVASSASWAAAYLHSALRTPRSTGPRG